MRSEFSWRAVNSGGRTDTTCAVMNIRIRPYLVSRWVNIWFPLEEVEVLATSQWFPGGDHLDKSSVCVGIAEGGWQLRLMLIFMASVAAPVVEETIFRGVLYRHLRSSCNQFPQAASIVFSVLLVSFIFAAIHPQGWVAIPSLMGIAVGVNLLREWRGSIIPSMVVHGVSNGIVVSMLIMMLS